MKKITITLLAILMMSALALSSLGCNVDWREAVTTVFSGTEARAIQRLDLNIPEEICKVEVLRETHSGMQNDGESGFKITFSEEVALRKEVASSGLSRCSAIDNRIYGKETSRVCGEVQDPKKANRDDLA